MRAAWIPLLAAFLIGRSALPCTTFAARTDGGVVVGKSYDWSIGEGRAVVNKRGVAKQALPLSRGERPARWISRFGSVTFNQYGVELPNGGLNEAGLAVEIMWLDSSVYPPPDDRPSLNELQWIQYQLDNYAAVSDVVAHAPELRTAPIYAKVHYLACDRSGDCAAFEHIRGKLVVTTAEQLRPQVLTNHTHAQSVRHLRRHSGFGGRQPLPAGPGSLDRFVRAASGVRALAGERGDAVARAFEVLDTVKVAGRTRWQIVYDLARGEIRFRTADHPAVKSLALSDFDLECAGGPLLLDIDDDAGGRVGGRFVPYTEAQQAALVFATVPRVAPELPRELLERLVRYPALLPCTTATTK